MNNKTRFEILKRDNFRCQYCGRTSDDGVQLEVDHIKPLSKGGEDKTGNMITSCKECNRGKRITDVLHLDNTPEIIELHSPSMYVPQSLAMYIRVACTKCNYEWAHTIDEAVAPCPMCGKLIDIRNLKRIRNKTSVLKVRLSGTYILGGGEVIHRDNITGKSIYW